MSVLILHRQIKKMISMNKLIPILLLAFISQICYAAGAPDNSNSGVDDKDNHPHKAPQKASAPLISYTQGVLSYSCQNLYLLRCIVLNWFIQRIGLFYISEIEYGSMEETPQFNNFKTKVK